MSYIPNDDEIWSAVSNLPKDSAPGPDGFSGNFDQACWSIIGSDITEAILYFFKGFNLPNFISYMLLTLTLKVKHATSLDHARPISLCNFIYKIIFKILNERVRPLLGFMKALMV